MFSGERETFAMFLCEFDSHRFHLLNKKRAKRAMNKYQVEAIIKNKYKNLDATELRLLDEYCAAVEYRLKQVRESFSEAQCLKSWEAYRAERISVYNALGTEKR